MPAPKSSSATSRKQVSVIETGRPDGEPGSPKTGAILAGPSGPPPALPDPSDLAIAIVDPPAKHWLALLRYKSKLPEGIDPLEVRRALEPALHRARRALAPAEPEHITQALEVLAETLQVSMPGPDGVLSYIGVLQQLPRRALKAGFVRILENYNYP